MKVQFFKDFSKLSETSDLFIVETDQFGLIDGNGNSYDLIAEKISRKKNIRVCLLYIHMDLNLKYIKMMKKLSCICLRYVLL